MELRVSSYGSRAELEAYCERLEPDQKLGLSIVGTIEELKRFQIGSTTVVHGIPCKVFNAYEGMEKFIDEIQLYKKPIRAKGKGYGLNGQLTELK